MAMPRNSPIPNGPAWRRRATNSQASTGNAGSRMLSDPIQASTVSPSASPPSPASASPPPSTPNESMNMHSPPNSSTWTSGSLNGVRDT